MFSFEIKEIRHALGFSIVCLAAAALFFFLSVTDQPLALMNGHALSVSPGLPSLATGGFGIFLCLLAAHALNRSSQLPTGQKEEVAARKEKRAITADEFFSTFDGNGAETFSQMTAGATGLDILCITAVNLLNNYAAAIEILGEKGCKMIVSPAVV